MSPLGLHDLEKRSWRMTQRDGLMDILFGFLLLGASISALIGVWNPPDWVRIASLSAIQFSGVGFLIWMRKREVVPRLGYVTYSKRRQRRSRTMRLLLGACVVITTALVVISAFGDRLGIIGPGQASEWAAWGVISAVILIPIGLLAVFLDFPRLVLHGSLFVMAEFCLVVLGLENASPYAPALVFGAGSLVSTSIGVPIFIRFLRTVPRKTITEGGPRV